MEVGKKAFGWLALQDVSLYKQTVPAPLPLSTSVKTWMDMNKSKVIIRVC
jgi:hypothetical protein